MPNQAIATATAATLIEKYGVDGALAQVAKQDINAFWRRVRSEIVAATVLEGLITGKRKTITLPDGSVIEIG
jgi:hypothetical protein